MYQGPFKHTMILSGDKHNRKIEKKLCDGNIVNFQKPLTSKRRPKIYVIRKGNEIVYVGYTSQSITSRLSSGLRAKGKNGYHGYKWKNIQDEFELNVFVFTNELTGDRKTDASQINFIETIEAELVYFIRNITGKWPAYQNEVHFYQEHLKQSKGIAENLYKYVMEEK